MRNRFDRQLLELNNELIEMGGLIEQAIEMGISALIKQDVERRYRRWHLTRRWTTRRGR